MAPAATLSASAIVMPERVIAAITVKNRADSCASTTSRTSGARRRSPESTRPMASRASTAPTTSAPSPSSTHSACSLANTPMLISALVNQGSSMPVPSSAEPIRGTMNTIMTVLMITLMESTIAG
ncbi:MAG: hypothetical protein DYG92_02180 [Leptolyngbya sp. PLA1]|nr:hypothetical protein [Leptolyngbya sp. PLA1]